MNASCFCCPNITWPPLSEYRPPAWVDSRFSSYLLCDQSIIAMRSADIFSIVKCKPPGQLNSLCAGAKSPRTMTAPARKRGIKMLFLIGVLPLALEHINLLGDTLFTLPDAVRRGKLRLSGVHPIQSRRLPELLSEFPVLPRISYPARITFFALDMSSAAGRTTSSRVSSSILRRAGLTPTRRTGQPRLLASV